MSKSTTILRPLGLAAVLAVGFAAVYAFLVAWCIEFWEALDEKEVVSESLVVRADGTPLVERNRSRPYQSSSYHTFAGAEISVPENERWRESATLAIPRESPFMFPLGDAERVSCFFDYNRQQPVSWYFIHDGLRDGRGYFVGYDIKSQHCVGYIDRQGFRPDQPPPENRFPANGVTFARQAVFYPRGENSRWYSEPRITGDGFWKLHMISGDRLLNIDLRTRSVTTVLAAADVISLGLVSQASLIRDPRHTRVVVRTAERLLLFDLDDKQVGSYVIPAALRHVGFQCYDLGDRSALLHATRTLADHTHRAELYWIDASGKILRQQELALAGSLRPYDEPRETRKFAAIVPIPAVSALNAIWFGPYVHLVVGAEPNYASALRRSVAAQWPVFLATCLLSAVLAGFCYRRQKRYAQPWTAAWMALVFVGGPAGLVGYLFCRRWPPLEKCPACGESAPRDRRACAACSTEFPPPELKGTEVFA